MYQNFKQEGWCEIQDRRIKKGQSNIMLGKKEKAKTKKITPAEQRLPPHGKFDLPIIFSLSTCASSSCCLCTHLHLTTLRYKHDNANCISVPKTNALIFQTAVVPNSGKINYRHRIQSSVCSRVERIGRMVPLGSKFIPYIWCDI